MLSKAALDQKHSKNSDRLYYDIFLHIISTHYFYEANLNFFFL